MSTWLERNTRLKKEPFSFKGYEFQRRIADDMHPQMSVVKPSQVGLSELQLRKFLAMLKRTTMTLEDAEAAIPRLTAETVVEDILVIMFGSTKKARGKRPSRPSATSQTPS